MPTNTVFISHQDLLTERARREYVATEVNWLSGEPENLALKVNVRHGPRMADCRLVSLGGGNYHVHLMDADAGLANGQFSVFYDGDVCLGSGKIRLLPLAVHRTLPA